MGLEDAPKVPFINNADISPSGLGTVVVALGVVILLISCCGCATCKFKKVFFSIPFGICTGVIGFILLIIGFIVLGGVGPLTDTIKNDVCGGAEAVKLATDYTSSISRYVCSEKCPCPIGDGSDKIMWEAYGDDFFFQFERRKNFESLSTAK